VSQRFTGQESEGSTLQPVKLRKAKSVKGGVNPALTYHVSGDRNRRAREFDPRTHEGASCERCWYLSPSLWLCVEGTDKERSQHSVDFSRLGDSRDESMGARH
jgi:hypothetical protein